MDAASNTETVARFRVAWRGERIPDWTEFARELHTRSLTELCEIVAVDLVQRWQRASAEPEVTSESAAADGGGTAFPVRPLLEDYLRSWPALAEAPESDLCRCLAVEYAVRRRHGERPAPESYAERFPHLWPRLRPLLENCQAELAATRTAEIPTLLFAQAHGGDEDARSSIDAPADGPSERQTHSASRPDSELKHSRRDGGLRDPSSDSAHGSPDHPTLTYRGGRDDTVNVPPGHSAEPKTFGDYELLEEIARGGMGVVYRARQVKADRIVALKMIRAGQLADADEVRRFFIEARSAARLNHAGIVPVYDVGEVGGQHYFTMGYVDGPTLKALLAEGPLPPRRAAEIVRQIAEAVAYAHAQGVIHRDLKPSNVLIGADGKPRITDFGLAKQIAGDDGLTASGAVMGTPAYMPPEQAAGQVDRIGPHSDVYAIGAILYELLTGAPPFAAPSTLDLLTAVMHREPEPLRSVDRDLETICLKCLQKDPSRRYSSARELADELGRYMEGRPILARPVSTLERTWRWCRRHVVVSVLACALAVSTVVGLAFSTYFAIAMRQRAFESQQHYRKERIARRAAQEQQLRALLSQIEMQTRMRPEPGWSWAALEGLRRATALDVPQTHVPLRSHALRALCELDVRPMQKLRSSDEPANIAATPDGAGLLLVHGVEDLQVRIEALDLATHRTTERYVLDTRAINIRRLLRFERRFKEIGRDVAVSPDGRWVAAVTRFGRLVLWQRNEPTAFQVIESDLADAEGVQVKFFGDGNRLVASFWLGKKREKAWLSFYEFDPRKQQWGRTGRVLDSSPDSPMPRFSVIPGTNAVVAGEVDEFFRISWAGKERRGLGAGELRASGFHPSGRLWAGAVGRAELVLWDSATGRPLLSIEDRRFFDELGFVLEIGFLGDTFAVLTVADKATEVRVYDFVRRGTVLALSSDGRAGPPICIAPDGRWMAIAGHRHVQPYQIRIPLTVGLPPTADYLTAGFTSDGRIYAVRGDEPHRIRLQTFDLSPVKESPNCHVLWPVQADPPVMELQQADEMGEPVVFDEEQARIFAPRGDRFLTCWSAADGRPLFSFDNVLQELLTGRTRIHWVHPLRDQLVVATHSKQIVVVDPQTGDLRRVLLSTDEIPTTVHAAPRQDRVFIGTRDGQVLVTDWAGKVLRRWEHHDSRICATAATSDANRLLVAAEAGLMKLYDRVGDRWDPVLTFPAEKEPIRLATISPDGRFVLFQRLRDAAPRLIDLQRLNRRLRELGITEIGWAD